MNKACEESLTEAADRARNYIDKSVLFDEMLEALKSFVKALEALPLTSNSYPIKQPLITARDVISKAESSKSNE